MVEVNKHRAEAAVKCPTCKQRFVGQLLMGLAEARQQHTVASGTEVDCSTMEDLARACAENGSYAEALQHYDEVLQADLSQHGPDSLLVANTKSKYACWFYDANPGSLMDDFMQHGGCVPEPGQVCRSSFNASRGP